MNKEDPLIKFVDNQIHNTLCAFYEIVQVHEFMKHNQLIEINLKHETLC